MPRSADDLLLCEVQDENQRGVEYFLAAGASINGSEHSGEKYPPLMFAAASGSAKMVKFLLLKGADLEGVTWRKHSFQKDSRAIHGAVTSEHSGALGALQAVLEAGADVDAKDAQGCTALMMACRAVELTAGQRLSRARMLLDAGADATIQDMGGRTALHPAAYCRETDLIEMLLSNGALPILNHPTMDGKTPLTVAVERDSASVVSLLLSAGASQEDLLDTDGYECPFAYAALMGCENALRALSSERGMDAVGGGSRVIPGALSCVTRRRRARILHMVLAAEGKERQTYWANYNQDINRGGLVYLVCLAATCGLLANVKVLLAAGARATDGDSGEGLSARNIIGILSPEGNLDAREKDAIDRAIQRAPAYLGRSWAWPVEEADVGDKPPLGVLIFRPRSPNFFVRLVGR